MKKLQRAFPLPNWFILIVYALIVLVRVPEIAWPGRFWAEEGALYYAKYYTETIGSSIASIDLGYYSLFNKIAIISAAHLVPLRFAPILTMLFAFAATIIPAWLWLYSKKEVVVRPSLVYLGLAVILLTQPNQEVWLTSISSQFYFCVSTAIILITVTNNATLHFFRLLVLLVAGMTGAVSCLLFPFFWIEYALSKNSRRLYEALVLSAATVIQLICVVHSVGRNTNLYLDLLPWVLLVKQWILPIFGINTADFISGIIKQHHLWRYGLLSIIALIPYVTVGVGLFLWSSRRAWSLFAASVFVVSISFMKALEAQNSEWILGHISALEAGRYYYAPNVMLAIALLLPQKNETFAWPLCARVFRVVSLLVVGLIVLTGSCDYIASRQRHASYFTGPSWRDEVTRWENDESNTLNIWPRPWTMTIPKTEDDVEH